MMTLGQVHNVTHEIIEKNSKNGMNVCLTALNDWKYVEIYLQKWRKSLQKDRFSCSCFCLFSLQGLN